MYIINRSNSHHTEIPMLIELRIGTYERIRIRIRIRLRILNEKQNQIRMMIRRATRTVRIMIRRTIRTIRIRR